MEKVEKMDKEQEKRYIESKYKEIVKDPDFLEEIQNIQKAIKKKFGYFLNKMNVFLSEDPQKHQKIIDDLEEAVMLQNKKRAIARQLLFDYSVRFCEENGLESWVPVDIKQYLIEHLNDFQSYVSKRSFLYALEEAPIIGTDDDSNYFMEDKPLLNILNCSISVDAKKELNKYTLIKPGFEKSYLANKIFDHKIKEFIQWFNDLSVAVQLEIDDLGDFKDPKPIFVGE